MWTSGSVSKVIVTKIYVIISSSSHCLVYVLMTVIIKAFIANMLCMDFANLNYLLCSLLNRFISNWCFCWKFIKSFLSTLFFTVDVDGMWTPSSTAGSGLRGGPSGEVRCTVHRWLSGNISWCLWAAGGSWQLPVQLGSVAHGSSPRHAPELLPAHVISQAAKTTPDLGSTPADIVLVFVDIYHLFVFPFMQEATQSLQKDSSHLHYLVTTELNIQNVWI